MQSSLPALELPQIDMDLGGSLVQTGEFYIFNSVQPSHILSSYCAI